MTAVLEAIGMEKRFPVKQQMLLRRRDTFQALQGIDLALYSGQTLGVVGESGSGKSTLGEIFGDLQQPTSGIVRYKGQDIRSLGEKEYRRFRPTPLSVPHHYRHLVAIPPNQVQIMRNHNDRHMLLFVDRVE